MALLSDGARIRELRELKGLTQAEFARRAGFSVNHVSQVELGKSNGGPRFLRTTAKMLGCKIADITSGSVQRRVSPRKDEAA